MGGKWCCELAWSLLVQANNGASITISLSWWWRKHVICTGIRARGTGKRPVALQVAEGHELAMKGITPRFARQVVPFLDGHAEKAWPYASLWPGDWIRGGIGNAKMSSDVRTDVGIGAQ